MERLDAFLQKSWIILGKTSKIIIYHKNELGVRGFVNDDLGSWCPLSVRVDLADEASHD
jgi:hypothetical protein